MGSSRGSGLGPGDFVGYLEAVYRAEMTRDVAMLDALLQQRISSHLPAEVRAEALAIVAMPRTSLRAPIRLLQLQQRVVQLGDDETDDDESDSQLELEWGVGGRE